MFVSFRVRRNTLVTLFRDTLVKYCKAFYIGKFGHTGVSARTAKPFSNRLKSDIFDHCQKYHTDFLSENFTIGDSHKGKYGLEILGSLHRKVKKPVTAGYWYSTAVTSFLSRVLTNLV